MARCRNFVPRRRIMQYVIAWIVGRQRYRIHVIAPFTNNNLVRDCTKQPNKSIHSQWIKKNLVIGCKWIVSIKLPESIYFSNFV